MFFLPMFLLGLVSPQVDPAERCRTWLTWAASPGRVYAWSTFGAIVGTFVAGYVLHTTLGMHHTIFAVALVLTSTSLLVA